MSFNYQLPAGETRELMPFEAAEAFPGLASCVGDCSQGRRPCQRPEACAPAEACTDLGSDEYGPMYTLSPVEARLVLTVCLIGLGSAVSFVAFIARYF